MDNSPGLVAGIKKFFGFGSEQVITETQESTPAPEASHAGESFGGIHPSFLSDGSKMVGGIAGSGMPITINHYTTRMNARKAYQETPQAKSVVDRMADSVADTGLKLEATPKASTLGITEEAAEEWGRDVESRFDDYQKSKDQCRSGVMNLYQLQRLYQIAQHRDNDNFTRLYYDRDPNLLSPLQFEFIDTNQIRGYGFTSTYGINGHDDGIKRDDRGRELEYKIWVRKDVGKFEDVIIPAKSEDGLRKFMLHGYVPEYAGQGRGYSRLAHALQEFQQITDFSMASIQKAINQAMFVAAVKPSADEDARDFMKEVRTNLGVGPAASQIGSNPNPSSEAKNVTDDSLSPVSCSVVDEYTLRQPGLVITNLTKGSELKMLENKAPADSFDGFVDAFTSYLAASHSMPLEVLLMKFNQNFSASRAALLLFWRVVQIWRDEMAADFLNPIYEMWLSEEISAGRITAPGWSDPRLRAAWKCAAWIGSPAPDIDPSKTAKATTENMKNGLLTGKRAARNLNGSDHTANMTTLEKEFGSRPTGPWLSPAVAEPEEEKLNENSDDNEED